MRLGIGILQILYEAYMGKFVPAYDINGQRHWLQYEIAESPERGIKIPKGTLRTACGLPTVPGQPFPTAYGELTCPTCRMLLGFAGK